MPSSPLKNEYRCNKGKLAGPSRFPPRAASYTRRHRAGHGLPQPRMPCTTCFLTSSPPRMALILAEGLHRRMHGAAARRHLTLLISVQEPLPMTAAEQPQMPEYAVPVSGGGGCLVLVLQPPRKVSKPRFLASGAPLCPGSRVFRPPQASVRPEGPDRVLPSPGPKQAEHGPKSPGVVPDRFIGQRVFHLPRPPKETHSSYEMEGRGGGGGHTCIGLG